MAAVPKWRRSSRGRELKVLQVKTNLGELALEGARGFAKSLEWPCFSSGLGSPVMSAIGAESSLLPAEPTEDLLACQNGRRGGWCGRKHSKQHLKNIF